MVHISQCPLSGSAYRRLARLSAGCCFNRIGGRTRRSAHRSAAGHKVTASPRAALAGVLLTLIKHFWTHSVHTPSFPETHWRPPNSTDSVAWDFGWLQPFCYPSSHYTAWFFFPVSPSPSFEVSRCEHIEVYRSTTCYRKVVPNPWL